MTLPSYRISSERLAILPTVQLRHRDMSDIISWRSSIASAETASIRVAASQWCCLSPLHRRLLLSAVLWSPSTLHPHFAPQSIFLTDLLGPTSPVTIIADARRCVTWTISVALPVALPIASSTPSSNRGSWEDRAHTRTRRLYLPHVRLWQQKLLHEGSARGVLH